MKRPLPLLLIFIFMLTMAGCGTHPYSPAIITSSQINLSAVSERTPEPSKETASVLSVNSSIPSETAPSSKKSSVVSSKSTSSKTDSAVSSAVSSKTSSKASSRQNSAASFAVSYAASGQGIEVLSLTSPIQRGKTASVTVKGISGVEYTIKVIYKSGSSQAKGLEPKTAGSDGETTWSWKVSAGTTAGNWSIEISGDGTTVTMPFIVTE